MYAKEVNNLSQKRYVQILILGVIFIIGGYTIADSLFSEQDSPPKVGEQAPDFTLPGLDQDEYSLDDFRGKTVLINFWGTFCPPCVNEMPLLQSVYEKYQDEVVILGVNLDEPRLTVETFVENTGVHFPILLDDRTVQYLYGVSQFPTTVVVNPDGKIVDIKLGAYETEEEITGYW